MQSMTMGGVTQRISTKLWSGLIGDKGKGFCIILSFAATDSLKLSA
jgi:hypothetical protein